MSWAALSTLWAVTVAVISVLCAGGEAKGLPPLHTTVTGTEAQQVRGSRQPTPLGGVPLERRTGLRVLVAAIPPVILDVDSGRVVAVRGVAGAQLDALWVLGVGDDAAVISAERRVTKLYAVRGALPHVSYLGTGRSVWAAGDQQAVWVQSATDRSHCTLRKVGLDGRLLRAPHRFPCAVGDPIAGSLGIVVNRRRVLDPLTGKTVLKTRWDVVAAAGKKVVLAGPGKHLTLLDTTTRAEQRLPWPSILTELDRPAVDPRGRFVALGFANPSWTGKAGQAYDVWLLDTVSGKFRQLPGMPAFVALKFTSMVWTADGRLVFLARSGGRDMVAVWRPAQKRLAVRKVRLPNRSHSGSDSFALVP